MPITMQTNVAALNAQRNMQRTMHTMDSSLSKLSSGYRITKAGDDAAGLGISENLRAQIRSYGQAQRNAFDGVSVIQTAEGALNEVSNMLIRMRELAMQSASDGLGVQERGYLNTEFLAMSDEIDRIASTTEFNGRTLIDGSLDGLARALEFQVGIRDTLDDRVSVTVASATSEALGVNLLALDTKLGAQAALASVGGIDAAIQDVSDIRANLGALGNRINSTINNLAAALENVSAANSRIRDVDVAVETSNLTKAQILMQAGVSVLAQANAVPQIALKLLS